jgi:superfamily II DNA or RNA helicase/HKD family nuclease
LTAVTDLSPGVYERLVTHELRGRLAALNQDLIQRAAIDPIEAPQLFAGHIHALTRRALRSVAGEGAERLARQVALANSLAALISDLSPASVDTAETVDDSHELLTAIAQRPTPPATIAFPVRPQTPLSSGALLVNGRGQPRIGREVAREMASASRVDLLCAFVKWHGLRVLEQPVRDLIDRGGTLRVITTTYMGATEQRALDRLADLGAQVCVSYETRTTRLHAKAWLFHRATGTSTAYVGSSNLSRAALLDGLEWNVRISALEQPYLIETFSATFDEYWNDPAFEEYQPYRDQVRLRNALALERGGETDLSIEVTSLEVRPYPYQQEVLEKLAAQREVHDNRRNLVVMATGTGKTVVAALDYRNLRRAGAVDSLLFVAHQEQILRQSRSVFRHVMADGTFGEVLVGGQRPEQWRHVFASVQSLARFNLDDLDPARFDMVIVDEFHHAEAPTYARLLGHLRPQILLGLTATPERADGQDILHWFGGHASVDLRLWEALERQLLSPFQYFGIHDDVDLSTLQWRRGQGYPTAELSTVYTGHHARARIILQAVHDKADPERMQALGFCVSIEHAEFMAAVFTEAGIPARAVTSHIDDIGRREAIAALRSGELRILFTVDLFNEGVDLPTVDTILMLRPTESATIFLQQLGRGLRLADGKACLTVLDFIGAQHAQFRFDLRYRALTGASRRTLTRDVDNDFPTLPAGCHIELDRVAKQVVLRNLRTALRLRWPDLARELARLGDVPLAEFLTETGLDLEDLYRSRRGGWTQLRRDAGLDTTPPGPHDTTLGRAIGRMLHLDDPERLAHLRGVADGRPTSARLSAMLHYSLWGSATPLRESEERLRQLQANTARCDELRQIADILFDRIYRVTLLAVEQIPLRVHARYSRDEVCAAFGVDPSQMREGVKWVPDVRADIFFVTLNKTERHYSPTTMYADHAITPTLFQWESQSTTSTASPTGQRYLHHADRTSTVHLFVRESMEPDGGLGRPPYLYAGPMTYQNSTGDRPMRILWQLKHPLPADVYHSARVAAG